MTARLPRGTHHLGLTGLVALALVSCVGAASTAGTPRPPDEAATPAATVEPTEPTSTDQTPEPEVTEPLFVDGPAIAPTSELAEWLGRNKGNLLRLPLVIEVRSYSVGPAWIGMTTEEAAPDAFRVELDQGALGIGLTDRLVPLCPETPTRCAAWIEGYWGPTVDLPGPPGFEGPPAFSVREVVALVKDGDTPHVKVVQD